MAEMTYASKGVGGTALGLSIGALGLSALNGGLGNLFNGVGGNSCNEDHYVNRYEASQSAKIAELETEIKLRDANTFTMSEMNKFRNYVDNKLSFIEKELCDQRVFNATCISNNTCLTNQVAQLMALTKLVVPIASICPTPAVATTTAG